MLRSLSAGSYKEHWEVTVNEVDVNTWKQQVGMFEKGVNGTES